MFPVSFLDQTQREQMIFLYNLMRFRDARRGGKAASAAGVFAHRCVQAEQAATKVAGKNSLQQPLSRLFTACRSHDRVSIMQF
jgi:hypothetical protein